MDAYRKIKILLVRWVKRYWRLLASLQPRARLYTSPPLGSAGWRPQVVFTSKGLQLGRLIGVVCSTRAGSWTRVAARVCWPRRCWSEFCHSWSVFREKYRRRMIRKGLTPA